MAYRVCLRGSGLGQLPSCYIRPFAKLPVKPTNCWLSSNLNGAPGEIARGLSLKITLYITNLAIKNAVIYTNEGNLDLRETVNEPLTTAPRDK
jgi:hypothetical protein